MAKVSNADKQRILMIVESPVKVKTLRQFMPDNYIIMASVGHFVEIANTGLYNAGIDMENDFKEDYVISASKKENVSKLKEQVKFADKVILATDPDREGESISWFLKKFLNIPESKYERITYHEITKKAIDEALKHPRKIDLNYCAAADVRRDEDKIVGFYVSQKSRFAGKGRAVGNVMCPALRMIVDLENEIENFKSTIYYELYLNFKKNNVDFKAKYMTKPKLDSLDECAAIANECKKGQYIIADISKKDLKENPKPPFITNTLLQELNTKFGLSAETAMTCAQQLFQGVEINGQHVALITYHRTDDATLAPEFVTTLKDFITKNYGKEYCGTVKTGKKSENAQEGHEGIRVTDLEMTPDKVKQYLNNDLLNKIYTIIYNRTVACCMTPAIISKTTYSILNGKHEFVMNSRELKFDGYRRAYYFKEDDEDADSDVIKETFNKGEILQNCELEGIEKHTNPPKRYTEATLIQDMDKLGIGRPSTYALITSKLQDEKNGYAKLINKELVPTQMGIMEIDWLKQNFSQIVDLKARAELEKVLDEVAAGKKTKLEVLKPWWEELKAQGDKIGGDTSQTKTCPNCGKPMAIKKGRYGLFYACTGYPDCKTIESFKKKSS